MPYLISAFIAVTISLGSLIVSPLFNSSTYEPQVINIPVVQPTTQVPEMVFGADGTLPLAGTTYTLSGSGVSGAATSITLTSLTIPQTGYEITDSDVSDTFYITLEPGNRTRQEVVSCTTITQNANDTATLSGCTRGLLPFSPYTASSSYQFAHGGGTSVIFSNPPQLYNEFISKFNSAIVSSTWTFGANNAPRYASNPNFTGSSTTLIPDIAYVNSVATSGAPDASPTAKGLVEISTRPEFSAGTATGDTSASLLPLNSFFNATSSATTTGVVTGVNGKISPGFISTSSDYTWSGTSSFTGSTTISGTTTIDGLQIASSSFSKFGGTGADGALNITAGTTTISLGNSQLLVKNYTSINITGGSLAFTASTTRGSIVILKSQNACNLTSGSSTIINLRNIGGTGGTGGQSGTPATDGNGYGVWLNGVTQTGGGAGGVGGNGGAGGASASANGGKNGTSTASVSTNFGTSSIPYLKALVLSGSGGGGGGYDGSGAGGVGGIGAGGLYMECNSLNFTGTIEARGAIGTDGSTSGAGGGGGGGSVVILYNKLVANTGSSTVSGGVGGSGSSGDAPGAGATGYMVVTKNTEF